MTLRRCDGDRQDLRHCLERTSRLDEQAVLDVDHDFVGDQQVVVERQSVLGEVDHALDRVLDRDETGVDLARFDGVEHVGHRPVRHVLCDLRRFEAEQCLLSERAERAEEADPSHGNGGGG